MQRGVQFEALAARHELRFDINRICQLEADFDGMAFDHVVPLLVGSEGVPPKMQDVRKAFRAGLVGDVTLERAGEVMASMHFFDAYKLLAEAIALAMPARPADTPAENRAARRAGKTKATA